MRAHIHAYFCLQCLVYIRVCVCGDRGCLLYACVLDFSCVYLCLFVCVFVYVFSRLCVCLFARACAFVFVCVCHFVFLYFFLFVCVCLVVYVFMKCLVSGLSVLRILSCRLKSLSALVTYL